MKGWSIHITLIMLLSALNVTGQVLPNLGGQRTGSATLVFLKNDASTRSVGMGGANITLQKDGLSSFTNPASVATVKNVNFSSSNFFIGSGINQTFFSTILPWKKRKASFMFTVNNLASGRQEVRTEFQPQGTGEYFYVTNTAFGIGIAKDLSDQFSFGIKLKYIYESLAQYKNHTMAADLGFLYKTDVRDLSFAVAVLNFGGSSSLTGNHKEVTTNNSTQTSPDTYPLPTTFKLGISMIAFEKDDHKILGAVQLNHPNDNSENLRLGAEYVYRKLLFVRAGYVFGRKGYKFPTFGTGFKTRIGHNPLEVNYAMVPSNTIGLQHSLGLSLSLHKAEERE